MANLLTRLFAPLKSALGAIIFLQAITIAALGGQTIYLQSRIANVGTGGAEQIETDPVDMSSLERGIEAARAEAARAADAAERAANAADLSFEAANDIQRFGVSCD